MSTHITLEVGTLDLALTLESQRITLAGHPDGGVTFPASELDNLIERLRLARQLYEVSERLAGQLAEAPAAPHEAAAEHALPEAAAEEAAAEDAAEDAAAVEPREEPSAAPPVAVTAAPEERAPEPAAAAAVAPVEAEPAPEAPAEPRLLEHTAEGATWIVRPTVRRRRRHAARPDEGELAVEAAQGAGAPRPSGDHARHQVAPQAARLPTPPPALPAAEEPPALVAAADVPALPAAPRPPALPAPPAVALSRQLPQAPEPAEPAQDRGPSVVVEELLQRVPPSPDPEPARAAAAPPEPSAAGTFSSPPPGVRAGMRTPPPLTDVMVYFLKHNGPATLDEAARYVKGLRLWPAAMNLRLSLTIALQKQSYGFVRLPDGRYTLERREDPAR